MSQRAFVAVLAYGALLGAATAVLVGGLVQPHCPTEDSCAPTYGRHWYGKGWTAKEVTP